MSITSKEIITELEEALKQFGLYTYEDKGANEVIEVYPIVEKLSVLPLEDEMTILKEVAAHEHGFGLVQSIVLFTENFDDKNGTTRLDELFQADEAFTQEYY